MISVVQFFNTVDCWQRYFQHSNWMNSFYISANSRPCAKHLQFEWHQLKIWENFIPNYTAKYNTFQKSSSRRFSCSKEVSFQERPSSTNETFARNPQTHLCCTTDDKGGWDGARGRLGQHDKGCHLMCWTVIQLFVRKWYLPEKIYLLKCMESIRMKEWKIFA